MTALRSEIADSTLARSSPGTLSPRSLSDCSTPCSVESALLRVSTSSRNFLSSSACASASRTMRLISSSERPEDALMTMRCSLPVALSLADTLRMPLASMSKVTSTCGVPRRAAGMSVRSNLPSDLLSIERSRSPCSTWMVTAVWLSSAVENTCECLVGMVVFFSMSLVITPPRVSRPSDSGVTSSSSTSFTSPASTPPWTAAPTATASSGFTSLRGSLPKKSLTCFCTSGMRVWPPTRITSATSPDDRPAS